MKNIWSLEIKIPKGNINAGKWVSVGLYFKKRLAVSELKGK